MFHWLLCFPPSSPFSGTLKSFCRSTQVSSFVAPSYSLHLLLLSRPLFAIFSTSHAPSFYFCAPLRKILLSQSGVLSDSRFYLFLLPKVDDDDDDVWSGVLEQNIRNWCSWGCTCLFLFSVLVYFCVISQQCLSVVVWGVKETAPFQSNSSPDRLDWAKVQKGVIVLIETWFFWYLFWL